MTVDSVEHSLMGSTNLRRDEMRILERGPDELKFKVEVNNLRTTGRELGFTQYTDDSSFYFRRGKD